MRGRSEAALAEVRASFEPTLVANQDRIFTFARELFSIADVIEGSAGLSRSVTHPARQPSERAGLVRNLFGPKVSTEVTDIVAQFAAKDVASEADFVSGLRELGTGAIMASAEINDRLDKLEEELFRAVEFFSEERDLRFQLQNWAQPVEVRQRVVGELFRNQLPETVELLRHSVSRTEDETIVAQLRGWIEDAAARAKHLTAIVTSARPIGPDQATRLVSILEKKYNRPVEMHLGLDKSVIGGMKIQIGSDVIDGTIATRLKDVRSSFRA